MNLLRYVLVAGTLALLGLLLYTVATSSPTGGWEQLLWLMVIIGAPTGWEWLLSLTVIIGLALNVLYLFRCPPR